MHINNCLENDKGKDKFGKLSEDGRIILKWIQLFKCVKHYLHLHICFHGVVLN